MIRRSLFVLSLMMVSACGGNARDEGALERPPDWNAEPRPLAKTLVYECADYEFVARLGPGEMAVWLQDRYMILSQVRSASGVKYQEGDTVFWSKGDEAMLELDGQRYSSCVLVPSRAPWEDARRRGVNFRAVGNEPGWELEIQDGKQILFVASYGMERIVLPDPGVQVDGNTRSYHSVSGPHEFRVEIVNETCTDTMKGDEFPSETSVLFDGQVYRGCGMDLTIPWE